MVNQRTKYKQSFDRGVIMGKFDEYLERARRLADEVGDLAKNVTSDTVDKAKELMDDGSKARELMKSAKEQSAAISLGAKEKVQGIIQDVKAVKEISLGIAELEALPEFEGSILYKMELETVLNSLDALVLTIRDSRMDDESVAEEIRKVMDRIQPAAVAEPQAEGAGPQAQGAGQELTDEQKAIEHVKKIAYVACGRALATVA